MPDLKTKNTSTDEVINYWLGKLRSGECLLSETSPTSEDTLFIEDLWRLMDQVWDEMGCDNLDLNNDKISSYYQHPVWLLNGYFIENHDLSLQHRNAISDWIVKNNLLSVIDFGGGFGTLGRLITEKSDETIVDIYEPFPSQESLYRCQNHSRIKFVCQLNNQYDCLVCTDVLEHVPDPLSLLAQMVSSVNINGYLLIANHFYPCIKCHLPSTFHFRYSFDQFAEVFGLQSIGICLNSHATIYQKTVNQTPDWKLIRRMERISQQLFFFREFNRYYLLPWKNRIKNFITHPITTVQKARAKFINF
ncbi:class I SAM-dependent methyltransferase [Lyngbya confervoides]|uniref:Class I SAM-dependent methyltransferase n=1 Tax=Lyngbya confervoides BDU141951 TaxID=1574623 RepID=A0ABD4T314_9CYAN|nr:methyltransferase domain-containing protein [Lyngbya confervoides]MCM1983015.1 class I SAM-dependent methyltransferase [Lyngbya confervoides BDU141951]